MTVTDPNPPSFVAPSEEHAPADREMTMLEHLQELRTRLVAAVLAVIVGILVALLPIPGFDSITHFVIKQLTERAPSEKLLVLGPGEGFFVYVEVALMLGIALAMPVLIYQLLAFVSPALYKNEKKYLYIAAPGATLSFVAGALFCYYFMLPFAIAFLGNFATDVFSAQWAAQRYLDFVTTFLFWVGITFELPIIMFFLAKLGIVRPESMVRFRRYAFIGAFIIGAMITPTPDPINQAMVSLPIYLLFELGIILARFA